MHCSSRRVAISIVFLALSISMSATGHAQQMRRSGGDAPGPTGEAPRGIPRDARHPYAGVWDGFFEVKDATRGDHNIPIVMVMILSDSAKGEYSGATILPNGARAPHLETTVASGEMRWKQENSGGGFWMYAGNIVSRDSIAGTVALKDWPQLGPGEKPPTGTFSLVRRAPGK